MEHNKITQELLAAGYTEKDTPPGMREYERFYGGWTYAPEVLSTMIFETPCGLLVKGGHFGGGFMSHMGIDWMPENNNPTVCCPRFGQGPCKQNHELLRNRTVLYESIVYCACHKTERAYCYEQSYEKAHDDNQREADALFLPFAERLHGRACKQCSRYNRTTKVWEMHYDPIHTCARNNCDFCTVLQKELSGPKGNVFYDVKTSWTKKGIGLFPDEHKVSVTKGKKLLKQTVPLTICEAIAKCCKGEIMNQETSRQYTGMYLDTTRTDEIVEILNIRAERRETRDLLQDLQDAAAGIEIAHAGDQIKAAKQKKRERCENAAEKRIAKLERLILKNGFDGLEDFDQRRAEKKLSRQRMNQLEMQRRSAPLKAVPSQELQQLSFF